MPDKETIKKYLTMVRELKQDYQFYDFHTHPFEFFFGDLKYQHQPGNSTIFCRSGKSFSPPKIREIDRENHFAQALRSMKNLRSDFFRLPLEKQYQCTGSGVFRTFSKLSGVENLALLPVAATKNDLQRQMDLMKRFFGNETNFIFGGNVPNDMANEEITSYLKKLVQNYHIQIVKSHPNVSGIDLRSPAGIARLEAILDGCNQLRLPLMVHGGGNLILKEKGLDSLARIENLAKINWNLTRSTHSDHRSCGSVRFECY